YLREAYRPFGLGRLMAFVFIFQVVLVAPLAIAGGAVGFADYLAFYWTSMPALQHNLVAAAVCVAVTALLYRDIRAIGRLAVVLYVAMSTVMLAVIPWQEAQDTRTVASLFIARTFSEPAAGRIAAMAMTALILFITAASLYAVVLGYSRIPFAAARDGEFFEP